MLTDCYIQNHVLSFLSVEDALMIVKKVPIMKYLIMRMLRYIIGFNTDYKLNICYVNIILIELFLYSHSCKNLINIHEHQKITTEHDIKVSYNNKINRYLDCIIDKNTKFFVNGIIKSDSYIVDSLVRFSKDKSISPNVQVMMKINGILKGINKKLSNQINVLDDCYIVLHDKCIVTIFNKNFICNIDDNLMLSLIPLIHNRINHEVPVSVFGSKQITYNIFNYNSFIKSGDSLTYHHNIKNNSFTNGEITFDFPEKTISIKEFTKKYSSVINFVEKSNGILIGKFYFHGKSQGWGTVIFERNDQYNIYFNLETNVIEITIKTKILQYSNDLNKSDIMECSKLPIKIKDISEY